MPGGVPAAHVCAHMRTGLCADVVWVRPVTEGRCPTRSYVSPCSPGGDPPGAGLPDGAGEARHRNPAGNGPAGGGARPFEKKTTSTGKAIMMNTVISASLTNAGLVHR